MIVGVGVKCIVVAKMKFNPQNSLEANIKTLLKVEESELIFFPGVNSPPFRSPCEKNVDIVSDAYDNNSTFTTQTHTKEQKP